jgi:tRNA threonylcarbamoyladenosine biosynthesis protein TsaE
MSPARANETIEEDAMKHEGWLQDAEATERMGQALARTRPPQALLALQGDLGAGKSTLARALLRALGVQGAIRSPTYTLIERYPLDTGEAWHLDLYRIGHAAELDFLGLDEGDVRLWLVEWPERGAGALPPTDLRVALAVEGQGRRFALEATSPTGREWLARLGEADQLGAVPVGG